VHRSELEAIDWLDADIEVVALVNRYC